MSLREIKEILTTKPKDKRSLHDLKALTPYLISSGPHISVFMKRQGVKEKDLFNMCRGLTLQTFQTGETAAFYGDKDISSRKLMILVDGTVSVRVPVEPSKMLGVVQQYLDQLDGKFRMTQRSPLNQNSARRMSRNSLNKTQKSGKSPYGHSNSKKSDYLATSQIEEEDANEEDDDFQNLLDHPPIPQTRLMKYTRGQLKLIQSRLQDQVGVINQVQSLYSIINRANHQQELRRHRRDRRGVNSPEKTDEDILSAELDPEGEKMRSEEVKYAKFNLSVLDEEIEKNFDTRDYIANLKSDTTPDLVHNTHPLGIDPNYRVSQDSDLRSSFNRQSSLDQSPKVLQHAMSISKESSQQPTPLVSNNYSALSNIREGGMGFPKRGILKEVESLSDLQAIKLQKEGLDIQDITFLESDALLEMKSVVKTFSTVRTGSKMKASRLAPQAKHSSNSLLMTTPLGMTSIQEDDLHKQIDEPIQNDLPQIDEPEDRYSPSEFEVWKKLSKEVNRTFLHVDRNLERNRNWLASMKCDLNDLQKSIMQAFNIDIRKNELESREIELFFDGVVYYCQNGVFMREVSKLQPNTDRKVNPCFGEFSLISRRAKQMSVVCESESCDFVVLDKIAFAEALSNLQKKRVEKHVQFLETIPCFLGQSRQNLEFFCKHFQKVYYKRNQILYSKGDAASHIFVVKKGEFELTTPLKQNYSKLTKKVIDLLGIEDKNERRVNLVGQCMPELVKDAPLDLPSSFRLFTHQVGSIMGEEDLLNDNEGRYQGTLKCTSQIGKVYKIHKDHFLIIKQHPESYILLINQILKKNKRRHGDGIRHAPSSPGSKQVPDQQQQVLEEIAEELQESLTPSMPISPIKRERGPKKQENLMSIVQEKFYSKEVKNRKSDFVSTMNRQSPLSGQSKRVTNKISEQEMPPDPIVQTGQMEIKQASAMNIPSGSEQIYPAASGQGELTIAVDHPQTIQNTQRQSQATHQKRATATTMPGGSRTPSQNYMVKLEKPTKNPVQPTKVESQIAHHHQESITEETKELKRDMTEKRETMKLDEGDFDSPDKDREIMNSKEVIRVDTAGDTALIEASKELQQDGMDDPHHTEGDAQEFEMKQSSRTRTQGSGEEKLVESSEGFRDHSQTSGQQEVTSLGAGPAVALLMRRKKIDGPAWELLQGRNEEDILNSKKKPTGLKGYPFGGIIKENTSQSRPVSTTIDPSTIQSFYGFGRLPDGKGAQDRTIFTQEGRRNYGRRQPPPALSPQAVSLADHSAEFNLTASTFQNFVRTTQSPFLPAPKARAQLSQKNRTTRDFSKRLDRPRRDHHAITLFGYKRGTKLESPKRYEDSKSKEQLNVVMASQFCSLPKIEKWSQQDQILAKNEQQMKGKFKMAHVIEEMYRPKEFQMKQVSFKF